MKHCVTDKWLGLVCYGAPPTPVEMTLIAFFLVASDAAWTFKVLVGVVWCLAVAGQEVSAMLREMKAKRGIDELRNALKDYDFR
jgi:hypothetical protein